MCKSLDRNESCSLDQAIEKLRAAPPVKFDQTVEISFKMGVDPRKSDQHIRGTVSLPNGTGKDLRVLVFAAGEKVQQALDAGADFAGFEDLFEKVKGGWTDFDAVIATPDMMREVGKLGKVLGPRGMMPTPKAGTVTTDVAQAVKEAKAGKIEFKLDRSGAINLGVGKLSFETPALMENLQAVIAAIWRAKPSTAKGQFIKSAFVSSTMGPGLRVNLSDVTV